MYGIVCLLLCVSLCGCSRNTKQSTNEVEKQMDDTLVISENTISSEKELEDLVLQSKELSVQMANGSFEDVVTKFSPLVASKLDESSLKQAYEQTTTKVGEFIEYHSSEVIKKTVDETVIQIVLRYKENGIAISYTYNFLNEINGLWLNYSSIPEDAKETTEFEEVKIQIGEEYPLDGMLTIPKDIVNPPVVILIQGSGSTDMDETIGEVGNKPFRDIAYGLAEKGIATIRYNKRYYQYPETATDDITIQDEVTNDVNFAISYATSNEYFECDGVYILGHSLGGMLAPFISQENKEVIGMISLAGSPRKLEDIILDQNLMRMSENMKAKETLSEETQNNEIQNEDYYVSAIKMVQDEIDKVKKVKRSDNSYILGIGSKYWYSLAQIDTPSIVKSLSIPMLFLQGDADFQVFVDSDYKEWQSILEGNNNATYMLFPNLNHLFMTTNGLTDESEYNINGNVSSEVIDNMADWIKSQK